MLRNIIIIGSTSGLVLFSKVFSHGIAQPRLVGSLITAIIEFGQQTTGMGVCYIELTNVSITMIANEDAKVVCALFYDREDGVQFGRLICSEIVTAFTQDYSYDITQFGKNLKDFYGFQKKIPHIVRFSTKTVIDRLESVKGIKKVLLMNEREIIHTASDEMDQLSILANLTAFMDLCSGISTCYIYMSTCAIVQILLLTIAFICCHNSEFAERLHRTCGSGDGVRPYYTHVAHSGELRASDRSGQQDGQRGDLSSHRRHTGDR